MADLVYQVCIGESRLYSFCVRSVKEWAERMGADHIVQTEPILKILPDPRRNGRSAAAVEPFKCLIILEKFNAFSHFDRYDRIALIDSDVFAANSAPNLFDELGPHDFAAVRERDTPSLPKHKRKLVNFSKRMFGPLNDVNWDWRDGVADFWNCGVEIVGNKFPEHFLGQSPRGFLDRPEFQRFINGEGFLKWSTEQTMMNWWVRKEKMKVKNLHWKWNCLYGAARPEMTSEAHLLHFFLRDKLPQKGENIEELVREITRG